MTTNNLPTLFQGASAVELTRNEKKGYVTLPAQLVFADLHDPKLTPGYEEAKPRYSATVRVAQDAPELDRLFRTMIEVARKTWGDGKAAETIRQICKDLDPDDGRTNNKNALASILNGDLVQPDWNEGTYVLKASRRPDQGRPLLFTVDGEPLYVGGELVLDKEKGPREGDGVLLTLRVWAMRKQDRINFTVEGVRVAVPGSGSKPAAVTQVPDDVRDELASAALPASIPGVLPAVAAIDSGATDPQPEEAAKTFGLFRKNKGKE